MPPRSEFVRGVRWQMAERERHGLCSESQCGQLFQQVQQPCDLRRRARTGGNSR